MEEIRKGSERSQVEWADLREKWKRMDEKNEQRADRMADVWNERRIDRQRKNNESQDAFELHQRGNLERVATKAEIASREIEEKLAKQFGKN